ncbi:dCTP deaminase domain-containing protein [Pseudomonas sp. EL_65y_Pfl2_R95]|uniref:dCTP deaminase domain-containing protein n=1 Tax=Pseudomonas sp. EL_65y_Pfl2_R95 TaxID=3088698 RepID=UPI0030D73918
MFWSGDKLKEELKKIVSNEDGSTDNIKVDCAAVSLTLGDEIYITPSDPDNSKDTGVKKKLTDKKSQFVIPKGQFAFLLTNEIITVPNDALAFISFKATYKFKGLINVSGFHVDPGWHGRLIFSVYNAGPLDITLEKGDAFALIWFADLDRVSTEDYKKKATTSPLMSLDSKLISNMTGEVFSPVKLKSELDALKKEILTLESKIVTRYSTVVFAIFVAILGFGMRDKIFEAINDITGSHFFFVPTPAPEETSDKEVLNVKK